MSTDVVTWRTEAPGVLLVTMDRRPANALAPELLEGLDAALAAAVSAGDVKVVVVASAVDGFFAAGADIKHMSGIDVDSFADYGVAMRAVFDRIAHAPFLSIAACDGLTLGGGLELACACTLRVSGSKGKFGLPEVKLGLIPGAAGTQRLPRLIGRGRALDLMLTGRSAGPAEAAAIGLVERVTDGDVVKAALDLAAELIGPSLPAQLAIVRTVDAAFDLPLAEGIAYESEQERDLFAHGEAAEGLAAFVAKRRPEFS